MSDERKHRLSLPKGAGREKAGRENAGREKAGKEKNTAPSGSGRFFMVAALGIGEEVLSEAEEQALKPHVRHRRHQAALGEAHRLAKRHGRAFVVLTSGRVVHPPDKPEAEET